ncbi:MAG TPA: DEAD/DEAH box helicase family protein [Polyangiaceae bacterium]
MAYFAERYPALRFPLASSANSPGLRGAQIAAAHAVSAHFFSRRDPAVVVMPTGSGKSVVMMLAAIVLRAERVLVVTPSRMVREQLANHFSSLRVLRSAGALPENEPLPRVRAIGGRLDSSAKVEALRRQDVVVGTVQALATDRFPPDLFDVVLWDEAHHAPAPSWRALFEAFPSARHVLFTATPFRRDSKTVKGQIVLEYPLARAREDGVYGRLNFEAVNAGLVDPDLAIARATERRFQRDTKAGLRHFVMVRASTRARAEELADLYANKTRLRLITIFGSHSRTRLLGAIDALNKGDLDGIVCVDMLGEGFDLPALKIAALHSPHKSLAVTLQFIGRFARTTGANTGEATFLAVAKEIESEAKALYRVGAEWNEIVEESSQKRIDSERQIREVVATFSPVVNDTSSVGFDERPIDLSSLWPFFHVKAFDVPDGVDFDRELAVPFPEEIILLEKSTELSAVVCVTRHVVRCRWSDDDRIADVSHDFFIAFYEPTSKLLFICSSKRIVSVYDELVQSIALGTPRRLAPDELNRVLRGLDNAQFFSIGLKNRSAFGNAEAYRIMSGPAADRAVQRSDGRFYDRGHCFGRGEEDGTATTIGFSSASKIWSNMTGQLPDLFEWCRILASKLMNLAPVNTRSNLDHLPLGARATMVPPLIVGAAWGQETYENFGNRLDWVGGDGIAHSIALLDASVDVISATANEVEVAIRSEGLDSRLTFRLDRSPWFSAKDELAPELRWHDYEDQSEVSLVEMLQDNPIVFYTANLSRLEGDILSPAPTVQEPFDATRIEPIDWSESGVDPLTEKPAPGGKRSLFDWVQDRLTNGAAAVIFNDDDSGEVADFVALYETGPARTMVELYHCKSAGGLPVPGRRVKDAYEVACQAIKCLRITRLGALRTHIEHRASQTVAGSKRFVRGRMSDVDRLLGDRRYVEFNVTIVQPGIGRDSGEAIGNVLAAANAYLVGGQVGELRVIGGA